MASPQSRGAGAQPHASGPPYLLGTAQLGGQPTRGVDGPICGVLLALFVAGAALNMTILQVNRRRGHKFLISGMLFGLCMARITAVTVRLVWATRPRDVQVAIAAGILTQAGVLILFIVNLVLVQRLVRAYHPRFGWSAPVRVAFRALYAAVVALLVMVITCTVDSFYTLDPGARRADRDVQLFAGTFLAALAFAPVPLTLLAVAWPRRAGRPVEKFGRGRMRTKLALVLGTATLLALGAGFRVGVNFAPRPAARPAWYHSKPCYYCFNFVIELVVVYTYALVRFDRRFHVPDGSKGPGDYAAGYLRPGAAGAGGGDDDKARQGLAGRINDEDDVFGRADRAPDADEGATGSGTETEADKGRGWEQQVRAEMGKEASGEAA